MLLLIFLLWPFHTESYAKVETNTSKWEKVGGETKDEEEEERGLEEEEEEGEEEAEEKKEKG